MFPVQPHPLPEIFEEAFFCGVKCVCMFKFVLTTMSTVR